MPNPFIEIHDHFDGSAHCVECGGKCRLKGYALFASEVIRNIMEQSVIRAEPPPGSVRTSIERAIGESRYLVLLARAKASMAGL